MPGFPASDAINLGETNAQATWVTLIADRDYFIIEASIAPSVNGGISGVIAIVRAGDANYASASGAQYVGGSPVTYSSTNSTLPTKLDEVLVGNRYNASGLITLTSIINADWKALLAAVPIGSPPFIRKGDLLLIAGKNLAAVGTNNFIQYHINAVPVTNYARRLLEQYGAPARVGLTGPA